MRILGFSKKWDKLQKPIHTTFRFPRKDKDWFEGEMVQEIVKPRSKGGGEKIGIAKIIGKEIKPVREITDAEAITDGFQSAREMEAWLSWDRAIGDSTLINKLTIQRLV